MFRKARMKKLCCSLILMGLLIGCITGCGIANAGIDEGEVVVLDNQQSPIENVLSIKEIIEVKDFVGNYWIDDSRILGYGMNNGVRNIAIYNMKDRSIFNLTDNKDDKEKYISFYHEIYSTFDRYQVPKNYVLYKSGDGNKMFDEYTLHVYDVKKNKLVKIDDEIRTDQLVDGSSLYYAKGRKAYRYDLPSNVKTEIVLPKKLVGKLKAYFATLDEYMAWHKPGEEEYSEFSLEIGKKNFNKEKNHNCIDRIRVEGNKLQVSSFNHESYVYDMEMKTFEKGFIETEEYGEIINIDNVASIDFNENPRDLCTLDKQGNKADVIDTATDFVNGFFLSPDKQKLVYEIAFPMGEDRKYIYDFKSKKKVTLLGDYLGIYWNKASDKLVCSESVYFDEEVNSKIVVFND